MRSLMTYVQIACALLLTLAFATPLHAQDDTQATLTVAAPVDGITLSADAAGLAGFVGADLGGEPGAPELPHRTVRLLLPPTADLASVSAELTDATWTDLDGVYHVRRIPFPVFEPGQTPPAMAPLPAGYAPASFLGRVTTGRLREYKMVEVQVYAYRYEPVSKKLRRLDGGTVVVRFAENAPAPEATRSPRMRAYASTKVQGEVKNFEQFGGAYQAAPSSAARYVIVTTSSIQNASVKLADFVALKQAQGFVVQVATESTWNGGNASGADAKANALRAWLQANYQSLSIDYVLLVGNPHPTNDGNDAVPMKMLWPRNNATYYTQYKEAPSDIYYADLTGNWDLDNDGKYGEYGDDSGAGGYDLNAEVFVGRIPYYGNAAELDFILQQMIDYQTSELAWRQEALLPMEPSDGSTPGWHLGEQIRTNILEPAGWTYHRVYDNVANPPANTETLGCSYSSVKTAWKQTHAGFNAWWTHGSTSTASAITSTSYVNSMMNEDPSLAAQPTITFQCSCNNGWPESSGNLGYYMLKRGAAIATCSASRVSWYYQGQTSFTSTASNAGMTYQYAKEVIQNQKPCGEALAAVRSNLNYYSLVMNAFVFNLYGDPAAGAYTQIELTAGPARIVDLGATRVTDPNGDLSQVRLRWTAPGANGMSGTVDHYEVRCCVATPTTSNWDEATVLPSVPSPAGAGGEEVLLVSVGALPDAATLCFAVRAVNAEGQTGEISNPATLSTSAEAVPGFGVYALVALAGILLLAARRRLAWA